MRRRWNWGTGIALIYTLFACTTVAFVVFAMSSPVDLVSADYYQRALGQDRRIEAVANARSLGAAFELALDAPARSLSLRIPGDADQVSGTVTLYRPSNAASDRRVPLALVQGAQTVDLSDLQPGRWIVQVEWNANGVPHYHEAPVMLP